MNISFLALLCAKHTFFLCFFMLLSAHVNGCTPCDDMETWIFTAKRANVTHSSAEHKEQRDPFIHDPQAYTTIYTEKTTLIKARKTTTLAVSRSYEDSEERLEICVDNDISWGPTPVQCARIIWKDGEHDAQALTLSAHIGECQKVPRYVDGPCYIISGTTNKGQTLKLATRFIPKRPNQYPKTGISHWSQINFNPLEVCIANKLNVLTPPLDKADSIFYIAAMSRINTHPFDEIFCRNPKSQLANILLTLGLKWTDFVFLNATEGLNRNRVILEADAVTFLIKTQSHDTTEQTDAESFICDNTQCLQASITTQCGRFVHKISAHKTVTWSLPKQTIATCTCEVTHPTHLMNVLHLVGRLNPTTGPSDRYTLSCINETTGQTHHILTFTVDEDFPTQATIKTTNEVISTHHKNYVIICNCRIKLNKEQSISIKMNGQELSFQCGYITEHKVSYNAERHSLQYYSERYLKQDDTTPIADKRQCSVC